MMRWSGGREEDGCYFWCVLEYWPRIDAEYGN